MTTFKEYMNGDVVANANPFALRELSEPFTWLTDDKVELDVKRFGNDGAISIKVKVGFTLDMTIRSTNASEFNPVKTAFHNQGYDDEKIDASNTGWGGDSVLSLRLHGGDYFRINMNPPDSNNQLKLNLRRTVESELGGYLITENLNKSANITIALNEVIRYAEKTGDFEMDIDEESENVEPDSEDRWGESDTPIDEDYHPSEDESLTNFGKPELGKTEEPTMGLLYVVIAASMLASLGGR